MALGRQSNCYRIYAPSIHEAIESLQEYLDMYEEDDELYSTMPHAMEHIIWRQDALLDDEYNYRRGEGRRVHDHVHVHHGPINGDDDEINALPFSFTPLERSDAMDFEFNDL